MSINLDTINASMHSIAIKDSVNGYELAIDSNGKITLNNTSFATTYAGFSDWKPSKSTVTDTESEIASTPLTGRLSINIENLGNHPVYLSNVTGVDVDDFCLLAGTSLDWPLNATGNIFAICATGKTADLRVAEFKA